MSSANKHISITPVAKAIPFDNSTNGFTSTDTQAAIEEAQLTAQGFPRAGMRSTYNGVVGNNDWLGPSELLSNTPLLVSPLGLQINEISWGNQTINVQFHIEFRTGSKTGPIFYTMTVTSTNPGYGYVNGLAFNLSPGTSVWAQYKDDGQNASDLDLVLWMSRIS